MATVAWENGGQPNDQGMITAVIDMGDGSGVQRFEGTSEREVADKLLQAQVNATQKIQELSRNGLKTKRGQPTAGFEARELTAEERMRVGQDINDPSKAADAIRTVVEAEVGAPLATVRETLRGNAEKTIEDTIVEAATQFRSGFPAYYPCPENNRKVGRYMQLENLDPTVADNYAEAFLKLREDGLLIARPTQQPTNDGGTAQPAAPTNDGLSEGERVRPRGVVSSGIRNGDSSGSNQTTTAKPKYSVADIEAMSSAEYQRRTREEAGFAEAVDRAYNTRK